MNIPIENLESYNAELDEDFDGDDDFGGDDEVISSETTQDIPVIAEKIEEIVAPAEELPGDEIIGASDEGTE